MKRALFLDRDGVINHDLRYASKIESFRFIDRIFELCRKAKSQDYLISDNKISPALTHHINRLSVGTLIF
jgi:hypothetical protein